jgi:hypothetical protein
MSSMDPGWYPDPIDKDRQRYWDGREWGPPSLKTGWHDDPEEPHTKMRWWSGDSWGDVLLKEGWHQDPESKHHIRHWTGAEWGARIRKWSFRDVRRVQKEVMGEKLNRYEIAYLVALLVLLQFSSAFAIAFLALLVIASFSWVGIYYFDRGAFEKNRSSL